MVRVVCLRSTLCFFIALAIAIDYSFQSSYAATVFKDPRNRKRVKLEENLPHEVKGKEMASTKSDDKKRLFLGILGSTPISAFINLVSLVSGFFTIYGWMETRDDQKEQKQKDNEKPETDEMLLEWNSHLEALNSRMDDTKRSLREVICRLDVLHARSNAIRQDCWQFIKPIQRYHLVNDVSTKPAPTNKPYTNKKKRFNQQNN